MYPDFLTSLKFLIAVSNNARMPNWVSNVITVYHVDPSLLDGLHQIANKDDTRLFHYIRPCPDLVDGFHKRHWCISCWGTQADAWDVYASMEGNDCIEVNFRTAHDPPLALYEYMKDMGFTVMARYWENRNARFGTWDHGEVREIVCQDALDAMNAVRMRFGSGMDW